MVDVETKVVCEHCENEADIAFCKRHEEAGLEEAFENGKKQGYNEGYEDARKEFEKQS